MKLFDPRAFLEAIEKERITNIALERIGIG